MPISTKRRLWSVVASNLFFLVLGLAVLELVFGAWLRPQDLNRINVPKDVSLQVYPGGLYECSTATITYSRDRFGLRGWYPSPDSIDVLTVGGSTTDQRYIADGLTWQDALKEAYARNGSALVVVNAGVDGQSTYGHIKNFDWWFPYVPNLRPRFILYYVGHNDLHKDHGDPFDDMWNEAGGLLQQLQEKSAIVHLVRTMKGALMARRLNIGHKRIDFKACNWTNRGLHRDWEFMASRLASYANRVRILVRRTRELGAEPIFVSQPSRMFRWRNGTLEGIDTEGVYDSLQYNGVDYYHMLRRLDQVTESVCASERAMFIDLSTMCDWEDKDFYDFGHMTPEGARKVGDALGVALLSRGVGARSRWSGGIAH